MGSVQNRPAVRLATPLADHPPSLRNDSALVLAAALAAMMIAAPHARAAIPTDVVPADPSRGARSAVLPPIATDVIVSADPTTSATSVTSPAFSTDGPNELLLAFISADAVSAGVAVTGVTGAGLTWTLVRSTNVQMGTAEIWRAFAPTQLSNVTVQAAISQNVASSMTVVSFTGVDPTGIGGAGAVGATGSGNANPGAPTASLVTTRPNSWVWGVGTDWDNAIARTPGPNQTIVHAYLPLADDTYWVQRQNRTTPASGTNVTINCTAPTTDRYNLTLVEVLAPLGSMHSISGNVGAAGFGTTLTLDGATSGSVSSNASGNYAFTGLPDGDYTVTPSESGFAFTPASRGVTVNGVNVFGINFTATPASTYRISGTVSPAGSGSGATVTLSGPQSGSTTADGSGAYSFSGMPSGIYTVTPSKSGLTFNPVSQQVSITNADVPGVNFTAQSSAILLPDLTDIIPSSSFTVTGTGASRQFSYTHLTFNGGSGPLVIQPEYHQASGNYLGTQYLYTFNAGSWTLSQQTPVGGAFVFHAAHGHFHYPFSTYGIYAVAPNGGIGAPVVLSSKIGFCIADSYIYDPTLPNAGALGTLGSCSDPLSLRGLDIGAVDEYDKSDDGQTISLAGVPDGTYWLRCIVDPDNYLAESNENNNETDVEFTLTGNSVNVLQNVTPVLPPLPSITLTAPLDGAVLTGVVSLTTTTPVTTGVQYLLDGFAVGGIVTGGSPYAFSWNTASVPDGTHWLASQTTDANGRTNTSAIARITVANSPGGDTSPPIVTVTDPVGGATVSASVAVGATAIDQSKVTNLQFYVDGTALGVPLTAPPYLAYWNTLTFSNGPHIVTASATDAGGYVGNSAPVSVTVDNSNPPDVIGKDVQISVDGKGTFATPVFSTTHANDFVVAFVSYDGPSTGPQSATVSGGGLSWSLLKRSNAQRGTAEIWAARASGLLSNVSVTCVPGAVDYPGSMTVIAFSNSSGAGVVGQASAPTGPPDIYVPGVAAGSWVFAVGTDWDQAITRVPVAGQTLVYQSLDATTNATYWVQSTNAPSTAFALVTIHDDSPTTDQWNYAAAEIVATRSNHNTAPAAWIQAPTNDSFYYTGQTIALSGSATDSQSPADSLSLRWCVDLAFGNGRVQPGYQTFTGTTTSYLAEDGDDGTGVRQLIKLTAADPAGLVSDTARVTIWPETDLVPSAVTVTPSSPIAGQSAHYAFSLSNTGRMPAPASRWYLRAGSTVLGQGDTAVGASASVALGVDATLPAAGSFVLRLTVDSLSAVHETNEANNASIQTLTVNPSPGNTPPVANAVGLPSSGAAPLTVSFSGATSTDLNGDSLTLAWTFGDGGTANGRLASHTYSTAGDYVAVLTVNDGRGGTDTASVAISASAPGVAFPATSLLDDFNRTTGLGANWADQTTQFTITSNALAPLPGDHFIEWSAASFGPNQEAFVTIAASSSSTEQNLMLKTQGATWSTGHVEVSYSAPNSRVNVNTLTLPSTWNNWGQINGVSFAVGDQFGARATSDGTVRVYKNGVQMGAVSVSGWPYASMGGRIGLSCANAASARYDDFGGGTAPAAALSSEGPPPLAQRLGQTSLPTVVSVSGAFPSPTQQGVSLALELPRDLDVSLTVLDVQGRDVWHSGTRRYAAGRASLTWDGRSANGPLRSGVYLARVRVGREAYIRRFAVIH